MPGTDEPDGQGTGDEGDAPPTDLAAALARLPAFRAPTVSMDGASVAVSYDVTGRHELHVVDVATGGRERWSDGDLPRHGRAGLRWGADGDRVFFRRDDDGDERFDVYALHHDGAVEPVFEVDGSAGVQAVDPTGERVVLGVTPEDRRSSDLHVHDLAAGETTRLTDHDGPTGGAVLSPDGEQVAYGVVDPGGYEGRDLSVAAVEPPPADVATTGRADSSSAHGAEPRHLAVGDPGSRSHVADWHPAGDRLLVRDDAAGSDRCGVYDLEADAVTWFGESERVERPHCFLPGGERFVATRLRDVTTVPVVYDLATGRGREPDVPDGVTWFGRVPFGRYVVDDDRVLFVHTEPTRRPSLVVYDLAAGDHEVLLDAEHGPFSPADFADAEHFAVESDGVPETPARAVDHDPAETFAIDALLWDSGERPSPLVVNPHGGPRARDTLRFDRHVQFLALRGYSVLQVNYRGSSGRGRAFHEALYGDWGGAEQGDVATAVERALAEHGWLDGDRVAVFGRSFGGYAAYWQLLQYPDLYAAGVAGIGKTDLVDVYEQSVLRGWMERHLGTPEENPALYEERSPVTHVGNLDAPLLVVHGVTDPRVPVSQARRLRAAMEDAGYEVVERVPVPAPADAPGADLADADVEYVELEAEGHGSADAGHRTRLLRLVGDFLDRRLGGD